MVSGRCQPAGTSQNPRVDTLGSPQDIADDATYIARIEQLTCLSFNPRWNSAAGLGTIGRSSLGLLAAPRLRRTFTPLHGRTGCVPERFVEPRFIESRIIKNVFRQTREQRGSDSCAESC